MYLFIYTYLNYLNVLSIEIMVASPRRRSQAHRRPMSFPSTMSTARVRTKAAMLRGAKMGSLQWTKLTLILLKFVGHSDLVMSNPLVAMIGIQEYGMKSDSWQLFFSCWQLVITKKNSKKDQDLVRNHRFSWNVRRVFECLDEGRICWIIVPFFGKLDSLGVVFKKRRLMQVEIHEAIISYNLPQINKSLSVQLWGGVPRKVIKC